MTTKTQPDLIGREKARYQQKGFGLVVSILTLIGWPIAWCHIMEKLWPICLTFVETHGIPVHHFSSTVGLLFHFSIHVFLYTVYYILYHFEFSFFDRYKSVSDPWPWYSDPENWPTFWKKCLALSFFNNIVITSTLLYLGAVFGPLPEHTLDIESLPSPLKLLA